MTPGPRVRVMSYRGPNRAATDRYRFDVLVRQGRRKGWDIDYLDPRKPECDVAVVPLKRRDAWRALHGKAGKVIGDITDAPSTFPRSDYTRLGGAAKYPHFFRERLRILHLARIFDGVVAGSDGQADLLRPFARRVWVVTDAIPDADAMHRASPAARVPIRLGWFGNLESLRGLAGIREALDGLAVRGGVELHLVTAPGTKDRWTGRWPCSAAALSARLSMPCVLRPWTLDTCARDLATVDVLLVPVQAGSPYHLVKPAGRVRFGMALGLPVVASSIPAHEAAIVNGHTGFLAGDIDDWVPIVEDLVGKPDTRAAVGCAARAAALPAFGEAAFAARYLDIIASLAG